MAERSSYKAAYEIAKPRPLAIAIIELPILYLKAIFRPSARLFAEEGERAKWDIVVVQLFLLVFIPGVLGLIRGLNRASTIRATGGPSPLYNALASLAVGTSLVATLIQVLAVPILFFIGVTIQFLLARAFSGNGSYVSQAYATLLYQVPLTVVQSIITTVLVLMQTFGRIFISPIIGLAIIIYSIFINIAAIAGVHRLSHGRSTAVVIIPYVLAVLLTCGLTIYFARLIISAVHNIH
ncbi:hypothetical protein EPA93_47025 [Ktedonosporobacter rubrisoli]|uniref:Yip1 domain-containing protein n=1 Tax=Ktedonosporobacter rubrisoli TaxID=2509675 RepID=A0A4P6K489_KTERU|nr:YIP1 family protein [Ktedonosporobacter rubrisoli]QBD83117.1 hypothetical protein EPA93_47025 [Ktedonosporobacter rubrisoli]